MKNDLPTPLIPLPILNAGQAPVIDLSVIRQKLATAKGREYWRSLEELQETAEFQDYVKHEFPRDVELWMEPISRRTFLKLMGASFALAFFSGCRKPLEKIIPYNVAPEDAVEGKPLYFASALPFQGYARGVLVKNNLGRPTKIEGNPEHPDSLGATDVFMQAAVLSFYDPDRSQGVTHEGSLETWGDFLNVLRIAMDAQGPKQGAGLRILTETVTSPTLGSQLKRLLKRWPAARWHQYEPIARDSARSGARMAFGEAIESHYRFEEADIVLSLDADFLTGMPGSLNYSRAFMDRRRVAKTNNRMNRLYAIEPTPTITGAMADHRLPLPSTSIESFVRRLAEVLGAGPSALPSSLPKEVEAWLRAAARDLEHHRGRSLVIPGDHQPPEVHALAHAINHALGNNGKTIIYTDPVETNPEDQAASLKALVRDMNAGQVELLLMLGGNPAYSAPADLGFSEALAKVKSRVHLSLYEDETSALCHWHLPEAHPLESWGDLRAYDGTVSILQPQIEPLYGGKTAQELLSAMLDGVPQSAHDLIHDYWKSRSATLDFENAWQKSVHDGVVAGTALPSSAPALKALSLPPLRPADPGELEIVFKPDPSIWDGRFANNGWLQELPKPFSKVTWDNVAYLSPALAERLSLQKGDVVRLSFKGRSVEAPVWILPGQAENSVSVTLGYGRTKAGRAGDGAGFNAYAIRTLEAPWFGGGLHISKTGKTYKISNTQNEHAMEGRDLVRVATLAEFERDPRFAQSSDPSQNPAKDNSLYRYSEPKRSDEYAWAMGIDLNMCTGCNACMIACQAENNIPVVGKEEVYRGRAMHWIRVDQYNSGNLENPEITNQPVPCMHCEDAPCEVVCPVGATVHSEEGLNQMVYNRCIGTRYCSNNCPYKVRRFNFFDYTQEVKGPLKLLQNPDVTVRSRGVMEKCTYCVQRINVAKIQSEEDGRTVRDGEIVPACAQACPSRAIVFGNILDKNSAVSKLKAEPRDYGILTELGTRPRTTYQARLKNPNPEIRET